MEWAYSGRRNAPPTTRCQIVSKVTPRLVLMQSGVGLSGRLDQMGTQEQAGIGCFEADAASFPPPGQLASQPPSPQLQGLHRLGGNMSWRPMPVTLPKAGSFGGIY